MIRNQAHHVLMILNVLISYVRKYGGNKDTYILDGLRQARENLIKVYGEDV
jgi:hypothetical protein